jgi:hypothetical protein
MVHDEIRGVIQECDRVNDVIASRRVTGKLCFMQIDVPQVIGVFGDEPVIVIVIVNTDRSFHGR